jgi:GntR family transcriptional regulator
MDTALVRNPIYQQLNRSLRALIRGAGSGSGSGAGAGSGAREGFAVGDRFLTEREICGRFGVSRATANKALANLVSEGVLEFRKGVGTFVRGGVLDYDLRALVSFTDKARAAGKTPSTRVLGFRTVRAAEAGADTGPDPAAALRLRPDDEVYELARLRLADREPVILERRHIAAGLCPGLKKADLAGSLYALWTERFGLSIAGAEQSIRAVNLGSRDAELLGVRRGAAALLVESIGVLADDRPLWRERTLYRADAYGFHNRLGAIQTARPAVGRLNAAR